MVDDKFHIYGFEVESNFIMNELVADLCVFHHWTFVGFNGPNLFWKYDFKKAPCEKLNCLEDSWKWKHVLFDILMGGVSLNNWANYYPFGPF